MKFSTALHIVSLELRKIFTYRLSVWMRLGMMVFTQVAVGYFLWGAIFKSQNISVLNGFTLPALLAYYVVVPFAERMVRGPEMGFISREIYDGTFTRYLLYPVSFLQYKFLSFICISLFSLIQLILACTLLGLIVGIPEELNVSMTSVVCALVMIFGSIYLYFILTVLFELISFYVDNVWSLNILLRMAMRFLGGSLFPLAFFPETFLSAIKWTPFPYLLGMPIEMVFGRLSIQEWGQSLMVMTCWGIVLSVGAQILYARGTRQYSGVGV